PPDAAYLVVVEPLQKRLGEMRRTEIRAGEIESVIADRLPADPRQAERAARDRLHEAHCSASDRDAAARTLDRQIEGLSRDRDEAAALASETGESFEGSPVRDEDAAVGDRKRLVQ